MWSLSRALTCNGRVANAPPVATLDDLWVDVGAASKAEVQRLGIEMLDPVVRDAAVVVFADFVSGPLAGVRVGCAAVASAAQNGRNGETIFLLTTLRSFGHDGFEVALRSLGRVDEVTVVDQVVDAQVVPMRGPEKSRETCLPCRIDRFNVAHDVHHACVCRIAC